MGVLFRTAIVAAALLLPGCGGSSPSDPSPNPNPDPGQPRIIITAAGVDHHDITIAAGQRVLFTNSDSRSHEMNSDPHPEHGSCPPIDVIGFLNPGQTKETGNFVTPMTCGYHDHNQPDNTTLQGRITIR
jgi:hypothetical protein